jgi:hypothetical protein
VSDDELTTALCEILAAADVGVWRPDGPAYTVAEVGIFYGPIDPDPDRAVGITVYGSTDDVQTALAVRRVQIRIRGARGARAGADQIAGQVFTALQRLSRTRGIAHVHRESSAQLGTDANARRERADNYLITLDNPEA